MDWLRKVIEEEARRAEAIVRMGGILVRPIDSATEDGELGPLGLLEKAVVTFLESVRRSERMRSLTKTLRPKDLDEAHRGPLGEAEMKAVAAIREILDSERLRVEQSMARDKIVRPIDIPGPLGEFEMAVLDVVEAEQQRQADSEESGSILVRPKDATVKGPLGELEEMAVEAVNRLTSEEKVRLQNIQRFLDENRPMEQEEWSVLGVFESVAVGILRAPILMVQIFKRVKDLMESEPLDEADAKLLESHQEKEEPTWNAKE